MGGDDVADGGDGNDVFTAGVGNDYAVGGVGDDQMAGNADNDELYGESGNDTLEGGAGADTLDGNNGIDTLAYASSAAAVSINLLTSSLSGGDAAGDTIRNIENVTGSAFADTIVGSDATNTIDGGGGSDLMAGGLGGDTYLVDSASDIVVELTGQGTDVVQTSASDYTLADGVENLTLIGAGVSASGNALSNVLTGNSNANVISGLDSADTIYGGSGNDTLNGGAGNDTLNGGTNTDSMTGGLGNDTFVVNLGGDVASENANEGTDIVQSVVTYTIGANIENLTLTGTAAINGTGNTLDNIILGNDSTNALDGGSGNDTLDGGLGADTLVGGTGNDVFMVDVAGDVLTESASQGVDEVQSLISFTLAANFENLTLLGSDNISGTGTSVSNVITGTNGNNVLTGLYGADTLDGGAGYDTLDGGVGTDQMSGGLGDDLYRVDDAGDVVSESANQGTDKVESSITYTIGVNVEKLTLTGSGNIDGTGNSYDNVIIGNTGDNYINGGTGADVMQGGSGDDTYAVDDIDDSVLDSSGTDTVRSKIGFILGGTVENLVLTGSSAINGEGNFMANVMTGNGEANTLIGWDGADSLNGGSGADILKGKGGSDSFVIVAGGSGQTSETMDEIYDYTRGVVGTGDEINFTTANLAIGGSSAAATISQASINQTNGVATFAAGSVTDFADALGDIASRFTAATNSAGEMALFRVNGSGPYYMFISDGTGGVTADDVVVKLTGITSIGSIDLTGGDFTILA